MALNHAQPGFLDDFLRHRTALHIHLGQAQHRRMVSAHQRDGGVLLPRDALLFRIAAG